MGTVAVFGHANRCTLEEIVFDKVIVWKDDRVTPGSQIFVTSRAVATLGLTVKFLGSNHLLSTNAAGENMQKAKNIQDQYVSNLSASSSMICCYLFNPQGALWCCQCRGPMGYGKLST